MERYLKGSAVLIHGLHLGADDWENIMFGRSGYGNEGRILRGLTVAVDEGADYIFWGTGASEENGVKEGQYIFNYTLSRLGEVADHLGMLLSSTEMFIQRKSCVNTETQNTREEIDFVMNTISSRGIQKLFVVSSPTHGGRCFTEAEILRLEKYVSAGIRVYTTGSDISYANSSPRDVITIEPPHRGDRVQTHPLSITARKAMRRSREDSGAEFLKALAEFVDTWESAGR